MDPRYSLKEILALLVLTIIFVGIPLGVYLVSKQTNILSRATISADPKNIKIASITRNSFSVSWITDKLSIGFIKYGSLNPDETIFDDRDLEKRTQKLSHHVTLKNLEPEKTYYFKIGDTDQLFKVETSKVQEVAILSGRVTNALGQPPKEGVVYLKVSQDLYSGYIKGNGSFAAALTAEYEDTQTLEVTVFAGTDGQTKLSTTFENLEPLLNLVVR